MLIRTSGQNTRFTQHQRVAKQNIFPVVGVVLALSRKTVCAEVLTLTPLLGNTIMSPSETRYLGLWFMNREEAELTLQKAGKFYLWEGGFIGEAIVRPNYAGMTGNERLYAAGLLEAYDEAVLKKDQEKIADIMKRISLP